MILLPAIDIKDGQCVRLYQGNFATVEQVAKDPVQTAKQFQKDGAEWIHMVDLDGAVSGEPVNRELFLKIAQTTDCSIELGGGIRTIETIDAYLANGIKRVILGSIAVSNKELVDQAVWKYGDRIAVGIDAIEGKVKVKGWVTQTEVDAMELAKEMRSIGVETLIYTDIAKDGTMEGPSVKQLTNLINELPANWIASGGISKLEDLKVLNSLNIYGAILGKALYSGAISLKDAIAEFQSTERSE